MHLQIQSVPFFLRSCLQAFTYQGSLQLFGILWFGRHAMSLYLPWMTQITSECRFITCSCRSSSVPLCRWYWKDLRTTTPLCHFIHVPDHEYFFDDAVSVCSKGENFFWKPIIYTCDYRSVWLICISFIIPYQKASVIFYCFGSYLPSMLVYSQTGFAGSHSHPCLERAVIRISDCRAQNRKNYVLWWSLR